MHKGLRERNMGIFQGLTKRQISEKYNNEYYEYKKNEFDYVIPKGESSKQRIQRVVKVMDELVEKHNDQQVLIVTHGGFLLGFFLCLSRY